MDFLIREAKIQDAKGIAGVHIKTWQKAYKGQIPENYLEGLSLEIRTEGWKKILSNIQPKNQTYVAIIGNNIVGFCSSGPSRDEDAEKDAGEIYSIYIDQDYSGQGIGTKLLEKGLKFLENQGFKETSLWVLKTNLKGREFYERNGWKTEGKTKNQVIGGVEVVEIRYQFNLLTITSRPRI